jgi:hypothetical protein
VSSTAIASFTTSASGFLELFAGAGPDFAFFALGGVFESRDSSSNSSAWALISEASSSESGLGRFFDAMVLVFAAGLIVVCFTFLGASLAAVAFLVVFGLAFALGFYKLC